MKVVIAGGSGFLGNALAWAWAEESHDVRVLTRSLPAGQSQHESGTGKPGCKYFSLMFVAERWTAPFADGDETSP